MGTIRVSLVSKVRGSSRSRFLNSICRLSSQWMIPEVIPDLEAMTGPPDKAKITTTNLITRSFLITIMIL